MEALLWGMTLTGEVLGQKNLPYIAIFFAKNRKQTDLGWNSGLRIDRLSNKKMFFLISRDP